MDFATMNHTRFSNTTGAMAANPSQLQSQYHQNQHQHQFHQHQHVYHGNGDSSNSGMNIDESMENLNNHNQYLRQHHHSNHRSHSNHQQNHHDHHDQMARSNDMEMGGMGIVSMSSSSSSSSSSMDLIGSNSTALNRVVGTGASLTSGLTKSNIQQQQQGGSTSATSLLNSRYPLQLRSPSQDNAQLGTNSCVGSLTMANHQYMMMMNTKSTPSNNNNMHNGMGTFTKGNVIADSNNPNHSSPNQSITLSSSSVCASNMLNASNDSLPVGLRSPNPAIKRTQLGGVSDSVSEHQFRSTTNGFIQQNESSSSFLIQSVAVQTPNHSQKQQQQVQQQQQQRSQQQPQQQPQPLQIRPQPPHSARYATPLRRGTTALRVNSNESEGNGVSVGEVVRSSSISSTTSYISNHPNQQNQHHIGFSPTWGRSMDHSTGHGGAKQLVKRLSTVSFGAGATSGLTATASSNNHNHHNHNDVSSSSTTSFMMGFNDDGASVAAVDESLLLSASMTTSTPTGTMQEVQETTKITAEDLELGHHGSRTTNVVTSEVGHDTTSHALEMEGTTPSSLSIGLVAGASSVPPANANTNSDTDGSVMKAATAVVAAATVAGLVSPRSATASAYIPHQHMRTPRLNLRPGTSFAALSPRSSSLTTLTMNSTNHGVLPYAQPSMRRVQADTISITSDTSSSGMITNADTATSFTTSLTTIVAPLPDSSLTGALHTTHMTPHAAVAVDESSRGDDVCGEADPSASNGNVVNSHLNNSSMISLETTRSMTRSNTTVIAPSGLIVSNSNTNSNSHPASSSSPTPSGSSPQIVLHDQNCLDVETRQRMEMGMKSAQHGAYAAAQAALECLELIKSGGGMHNHTQHSTDVSISTHMITPPPLPTHTWPFEVSSEYTSPKQLREQTQQLLSNKHALSSPASSLLPSSSPSSSNGAVLNSRTKVNQTVNKNESNVYSASSSPAKILAAKYYSDGAVYEGELDANTLRRSGYGTFINRHGDTYEGAWLDDKRHGCGIYTWCEGGGCYRGEWYLGKMDGLGAFIWPNGDEYWGNWSVGRMHGLGKKRLSNGDIHYGLWQNDTANGLGHRYFSCGDRHDGLYRNDKRHGYGVYTWANSGEKYEGEWVDGTMTGKGKKYILGGDIYEGDWVRDLAHGLGVKTFACGDCHTGAYRLDQRHGYGVYQWTNGDRFEGFWLDGEQCKRGTYWYANGNVFTGYYVRGKKHGKGLFTTGATTYEEVWDHGVRKNRSVTRYWPRRLLHTTQAHGDCTPESPFGPVRMPGVGGTAGGVGVTTGTGVIGSNSSNHSDLQIHQTQPTHQHQLHPMDTNEGAHGLMIAQIHPVQGGRTNSHSNATNGQGEVEHDHTQNQPNSNTESISDVTPTSSAPLFYISPHTVRHYEPNSEVPSTHLTNNMNGGAVSNPVRANSSNGLNSHIIADGTTSRTHHTHPHPCEMTTSGSANTPREGEDQHQQQDRHNQENDHDQNHNARRNTTPSSASATTGEKGNEHHDKNHMNGICTVCYVANINCVLIRCGHMATCLECSDRLDRCPICRAPIQDVIQTYRV